MYYTIPDIKIFVVLDSLSLLAAESIVSLAVSHFEGSDCEIVEIPEVKTSDKAFEIVSNVKENRPLLIVLSTILVEVRDVFILKCLEYNIRCIDVLSPAVKSLREVLQVSPVYQSSHLELNDESYRRFKP